MKTDPASGDRVAAAKIDDQGVVVGRAVDNQPRGRVKRFGQNRYFPNPYFDVRADANDAKRVGVAVTGLGVVSGYGRGTEALWDGLCSGKSAVRAHHARFGGKDWVDYHMADLPCDTHEVARELLLRSGASGMKV